MSIETQQCVELCRCLNCPDKWNDSDFDKRLALNKDRDFPTISPTVPSIPSGSSAENLNSELISLLNIHSFVTELANTVQGEGAAVKHQARESVRMDFSRNSLRWSGVGRTRRCIRSLQFSQESGDKNLNACNQVTKKGEEAETCRDLFTLYNEFGSCSTSKASTL